VIPFVAKRSRRSSADARLLAVGSDHPAGGAGTIGFVTERSSGRGAPSSSSWANAEASSDRPPVRSGRALPQKALALRDRACRTAGSQELIVRRRRRERLLSRESASEQSDRRPEKSSADPSATRAIGGRSGCRLWHQQEQRRAGPADGRSLTKGTAVDIGSGLRRLVLSEIAPYAIASERPPMSGAPSAGARRAGVPHWSRRRA
jgi:hypothetical protein